MNTRFRPEDIEDPDGATVARAMVRQECWERLEDSRRLIDVAQSYFEIADDRGVNYAMAKLITTIAYVVDVQRNIDKPRIGT